MNDNELKSLWQHQHLDAPPAISPSDLTSAMQKKMSQLRRTLFARDARELMACVIVGVIFTVYFFTFPPPVSRLGSAITVAGAAFIAWKLLHARRSTPPSKADATVVESLRAELLSVRTQSRLLKSIFWWYLLPLAIGVLLFVWGNPSNHLRSKIGFTLVTLALDVFIYFLNQSARAKQLVPLETQLQALLHSAETGEPLTQQFMETQTIIAPETSSKSKRARKIVLNITEIVLATTVLIIGCGAYYSGIFFNAVYGFLFLMALVTPLVFVTLAALKKIYFGLLTKPFARESVRYWLSALPSLAFFASCGYLLSIAVVPCQYPNQPPGMMKIFTWGLAALQLVLALMPSRRVSIPFTVVYSIGTAFMVWHFVQIATPARGEKIVLDSPMKGVMCVVQGGNDPIINHHYSLVSQRYALDVFKVADNVQQIRDWRLMKRDAGFGETVYSPCAGRVAQVERNHRDNKKGQTDKEHIAGNYITIEIAPGRYVLICHLKQKSPMVKVGDEVKAGDPIAQCGNSGNTSGPHVHIQVQSTPGFNYECETFPIAFRHVLRDSKELENVQAKRNDLLLNTQK